MITDSLASSVGRATDVLQVAEFGAFRSAYRVVLSHTGAAVSLLRLEFLTGTSIGTAGGKAV
jgi:hypothetical protein